MCYSAQIEGEYRKYVRLFGATMGVKEFYDLFWRRAKEAQGIDIPKAVEAAFLHPQSEAEREIKSLIDEHAARQRLKLEQLLFEQKSRLVHAERVLQHKPTKKAQNDRRVATDKLAWAHQKLTDLSRTTLQPDDSRIFPRHYAPVLAMDKGQLMVMPMRYQCRPAGKPPSHDTQFPGTYNARRDSLQGYWSGLFGYQHGVVLASAFYEHVKRHRSEGRELGPGEAEEDVVLEFRPQQGGDMLVACLWSRWTSPGQPELLSFAAITDDPPPEVAAAGHDRCIIPIRPENLEAWLNPDPKNLAAAHAVLDDRQRPFYEHRLAA
jgi:putative SOS response-associated peptidase YedK